MKLLFVHGRSQQGKSSNELLAEWTVPLNQKFKAFKFKAIDAKSIAVPFYGDILEALAKRVAAPVAQPDLNRRSSASYDDFLQDFAEEIAQNRPDLLPADLRLSDEGEDLSPDRKRRSRDNDRLKRGPQNWWWVLEVVRTLDENFPSVSDHTIATFLRDVYIYLADMQVRAKIDAVVSAEITQEPTVVIAHSLGTVVAYNVLSAIRANVPLFVTLGSPLAIRAVANRLPDKKAIPKGVAAWFNAYDPKDIVALNPLRPKNFETHPAIDNQIASNFTENHHGISGYLSSENVVRKIAAALNGA